MISIVICSHNRSQDLSNCLAAIKPQLKQSDDEVIVVDSCSDQKEAEIIRSVTDSHSAQLIRLQIPGLSIARNRALASAKGEWVAFLDDDTIPLPGWLNAIGRILDSAPPELAAVGGYTEPLWPVDFSHEKIGWRWQFFLSCIQDESPKSVRDGANVCGANLIFRKAALYKINGFRPDLGRIGTKLISGEESLAIKLLLSNGYDVIYDPSIRVQHRIHANRLKVEWIKQRAFWEGISQVAVLKAAGARIPRHLAIPKLLASSILLRSAYSATRNVDFLIRSQLAVGSLSERLRFDAKPANSRKAPR